MVRYGAQQLLLGSALDGVFMTPIYGSAVSHTGVHAFRNVLALITGARLLHLSFLV